MITEALSAYRQQPAYTTEQLDCLTRLGEELSQDSAIEELKQDPYWPKWRCPWWKALLLYETGHQHLIPATFLANLVAVADSHYLHYFPLTEAELPEDLSPYHDITCFCALGNMYRVLEDCGMEVKTHLPWSYDWFETYLLPDGGYNCDEAAYTQSKKSSFNSTLPMMEALLIIYRKTSDTKIRMLLDKTATYLLNHAVYKSLQGTIIDEEWFMLSFPRYYDYDILRGFACLVDWAYVTSSPLPSAMVEDCFQWIMESVDADGYVIHRKDKLSRKGSFFFDQTTQTNIWKEKSESFAALDCFNRPNEISIPLTLQWQHTLEKLSKVQLR